MAQHSYEKWKPVYGYDGLYEVSDLGNVRSVAHVQYTANRWGACTRTRPGVILKPCADKDGYKMVRLCAQGVCKTVRVGRLVLEAFAGVQKHLEVGHLNDVRDDDRLANLGYQTRLENERQKTANGRRPKATSPSMGLVAVQTVREMRGAGFLLKELSTLFGVHYSTIGLICQQKTWRT